MPAADVEGEQALLSPSAVRTAVEGSLRRLGRLRRAGRVDLGEVLRDVDGAADQRAVDLAGVDPPLVLREVDPAQTPGTISAHNWISFVESRDYEKLTGAIDTDLPWVEAHTRWLDT